MDLLGILGDSVGIEVGPGAEAPPGPVEVVLAGDVIVHVPPVVPREVLSPVCVDQALDIDHGVRLVIIQLLAEDDPTPDGVSEGHHGGHHVRTLELDVGADPATGHGAVVDHHAAAQDTVGAPQVQGGVNKLALDPLPALEVAKLPAEVADLVLVHAAGGHPRAGGLVHVVRVEVAPGLGAGDVPQVMAGGDRELVDVETPGDVMKSSELHVEYRRMEGRGLTNGDVASDSIVLKLGHAPLGLDLIDLCTGEEGVWMLGVVESEVERPRALEVGETHRGVGVILLGEHALCGTFQLKRDLNVACKNG